MEYLKEIVWYVSLPLIIWVTYRFVLINLREFEKIESSDESEVVKK